MEKIDVVVKVEDPENKIIKKKYTKKIRNGTISTNECYLKCLLFGIKGKSELILNKDKTRESSRHDLLSSEVKGLILSILHEDNNNQSIQTPKVFEMKNKGLIRHVLIVHIPNSCNNLLEELRTASAATTTSGDNENSSIIATMKLSKNTATVTPLAHSLLLVDKDLTVTSQSQAMLSVDVFQASAVKVVGSDLTWEDSSAVTASETDSSNDGTVLHHRDAGITSTSTTTTGNSGNSSSKLGFRDYILSESMLRQWNYPLPTPTTPTPTLADTTANTTTSTTTSLKRKREEFVESGVTGNHCPSAIVGAKIGGHYLATLEEAKERLKGITTVAVKAMDGTVYSGNNNNKNVSSIDAPVSTTADSAAADSPSRGNTDQYYVTLDPNTSTYSSLLVPPTSSSATGSPPSSVTEMEVAAIDCEMCDTAQGLELTRLSILDGSGVVILDCYVKPDLPITDYRSQWSGITPAILEHVTVSLPQVQLLFLQLVSKNTILIGHALENDLRALKIVHCNCIDTSALYPHPNGYHLRTKLKIIAKKFLAIDIQTTSSSSGGSMGHDSVEDARTALQLVKMKLDRGPLFGICLNNEDIFQEPIFHRGLPAACVASCMIFVGEEDRQVLRRCIGGAVHVIQTSSDLAAVASYRKFLRQFTTSTNSGGNNNGKTNAATTTNNKPQLPNKRTFSFLSLHNLSANSSDKNSSYHTNIINIIEDLKKIIRDSQENGLLIVTGQKPLKPVQNMQKQKNVCLGGSMCASTWSLQQEEELKKMVIDANLATISFTTLSARTGAVTPS